ncbi:MAG: alpha-mannosidase [Phormidesmis sp.]
MASPNTDFAIASDLQSELNRLRQLNTLDIQSSWHWHSQEAAITNISASTAQQWPTAPLNERQHVAWQKGRQVRWLYQSIKIPEHLQGYPLKGLTLRLALIWWADDAQIYVNGTLVQSGDLFECFTRLCLSTSVKPKETFEVAIRLVSPGHDDGALVRSQLIYELRAQQPIPEPSFIADELTVLATLEPSSQPHIQAALSQLNWNSLIATDETTVEPNADALWNNLSAQAVPATIHPFQQSLSQLRRTLLPLCAPLKQRSIQCVGHAHLDMAWLWPIADTWDAAERTFKSVLDLQKDFPDLTYTHSSPALFEWLEHNRPELFKQIQQKVKEGSWSIDAGLWIEPEFNLISGEAIARHILYGQRYCQEKFGTISKIAWLPDSFGFCWQLPQLLTQGGIETFATLKLSWNDTTQFPHSLFWWQSPDGSRIRALMLPPIGSDIEPIKMSAYASQWERSTGIPDSLWLPGLGDHGGGPTRDMLEKAHRWQASPFFPKLNFTTPDSFINNLSSSSEDNLPVWKDELYLELHRGCYTTHADQKQQNRRCEDLLYQAEAFATVAQLIANQPYPKAQMDTAWKKLLFNQFHDILPGTSIPEVFIDANRDWQQVKKLGNQVLSESIEAIASTISIPNHPYPQAKPIIVFNSLSWQHTAIVTLSLAKIDAEQRHTNWIVYDSNQQVIPSQETSTELGKPSERQILFLAKNLPALGYQCFWIRPDNTKPTAPQQIAEYSLENELLRASIDPTTGNIASLIEKTTQTEAFRSPGNQLQAFRDNGEYWDAWNIAPDYASHPLPQPILHSIQWMETGPVRQRLRTTYQLNQSTIIQDYILDKNTPFLSVENHIDWQETQVLLKVRFPLAISSDLATYEIPFGAITRNTNPHAESEKAKWEIPALRWASLGNSNFGVSIITDCKHGFDHSPNHLRLTLLKSPTWPDSKADKGSHKFTYAIYPHSSSWQTARIVQHARAFSIKPIVYQPERSTTTRNNKTSSSSSTCSFLEICNPNIILSALKPAEDNPNEFILRSYEAYGKATNIKSKNLLGLSNPASEPANRNDLLEKSIDYKRVDHIHPWQVSTYRLKKEKFR